MNKQEVVDHIDKLANKELSPGCVILKQCYLGKDRTGKVFAVASDKVYVHFKGATYGESIALSEFKFESSPYKILGHSVMLVDVLQKYVEWLGAESVGEKVKRAKARIEKAYPHKPRLSEVEEVTLELIELWGECSLVNSVQKIVEKCGFETIYPCECGKTSKEGTSAHDDCWGTHHYARFEQLADPAARSLLEFIGGLGIT